MPFQEYHYSSTLQKVLNCNYGENKYSVKLCSLWGANIVILLYGFYAVCVHAISLLLYDRLEGVLASIHDFFKNFVFISAVGL